MKEKDQLFKELEYAIKNNKFEPLRNSEKEIIKNLKYSPFEEYILFAEAKDLSSYMFWTELFESIFSGKFNRNIQAGKLIIENIEVEKNGVFNISVKDIGQFYVKFHNLKEVDLIYNGRSYRIDLTSFFGNLLVEKIQGSISFYDFNLNILTIHTNLQKLNGLKLEEVFIDFNEKLSKFKLVLDFTGGEIIELKITQKGKKYQIDFGNFIYEISV